MQLNTDNCKVMHLGKKNLRFKYTVVNLSAKVRHSLSETVVEKDLGVLITQDLKFSRQSASAAHKANSMFGVLKNTFVSRDVEIWKRLYTSLIRPHLEFAVPVWNPQLKKDINLLEKVQRRVTKWPHSLRGLGYKSRCDKLGLTSLQTRRTRGDLIQMFKFQKGLDTINWHTPPEKGFRRSRIRGELVVNCQQRLYFFNKRIVKD